jgi:hypothetical protein
MTAWQKMLTCLGYTAIAVWMAAAILGEFGLCGLNYINILAAFNQPQPNDFEVRSQLLMEAMNDVGVCCPRDAAQVWAEGLRNRSAALQYAVMNAPLKDEYARQLSETAPNWVTGISSPFISAYRIVSTETVSNTLQRIVLRFSLATSTGPVGEVLTVLDISMEGSYWRIENIDADEALYPYTKFMPF